MVEFFEGKPFPQFYTASFFVLISKVANPVNFNKFWSISSCLVFYKLCSKILVNRLVPLLDKFIAPEQGAFILGRSIFENISLTQEMIHSINRPSHGGNFVMKIDMIKA